MGVSTFKNAFSGTATKVALGAALLGAGGTSCVERCDAYGNCAVTPAAAVGVAPVYGPGYYPGYVYGAPVYGPAYLGPVYAHPVYRGGGGFRYGGRHR